MKDNNSKKKQRVYSRPDWVPQTVTGEEELCPDCFKVVGERSRYNLVCMLGKTKNGMTVTEITKKNGIEAADDHLSPTGLIIG